MFCITQGPSSSEEGINQKLHPYKAVAGLAHKEGGEGIAWTGLKVPGSPAMHTVTCPSATELWNTLSLAFSIRPAPHSQALHMHPPVHGQCGHTHFLIDHVQLRLLLGRQPSENLIERRRLRGPGIPCHLSQLRTGSPVAGTRRNEARRKGDGEGGACSSSSCSSPEMPNCIA